jgi:hypothetical protein
MIIQGPAATMGYTLVNDKLYTNLSLSYNQTIGNAIQKISVLNS